jgi:predicted NBD/HSP70 family sugar kinase
MTMSVSVSAEVQVEQQEDDRERHRHDQLQARLGPFQIFELAAPGDAVARGSLTLWRSLLGIAT